MANTSPQILSFKAHHSAQVQWTTLLLISSADVHVVQERSYDALQNRRAQCLGCFPSDSCWVPSLKMIAVQGILYVGAY